MSRSNYREDIDNWQLIKWRGMVASETRGRRGQKLFRDLLAALEAMPEKRLIASELETETGDVCALGAVGKARGVDMSAIDPEEPEQVAPAFDIAECLAQEIAFMNDEWDLRGDETPEGRWTRMRDWVKEQIAATQREARDAHPGR